MFGRMVLARRHALDGASPRCSRSSRSASPSRCPAEQHGSQVLRALGREHHARARPVGRQHVRQGGPLRHRQHRRSGRRRRPTPRTARSTAATTRSPPAGGAVPLVNIFLGEVIFGGVGSGLYGMFFYILIAVFVAGLMVGRTPEWLGKKIEAREIKLAALGALFVPTMVLVADRARDRHARAASPRSTTPASTASPRRSTPTTRRRTTTAARSPATARRTSRRASARSRCYFGRFVPLLAALAIGGSLAAKKTVPASAGTFRTDGADVRRAARRRDRAHRRPDDLPGADARADRRGADALMLRDARGAR